jgi:magnesium transporter
LCWHIQILHEVVPLSCTDLSESAHRRIREDRIDFIRITAWSSFSSIYGEHWLLVAVTVALALVGVVLWGTLVGSLLPFLLRRLGFDPAVSSAPFVATLVDVTGLVIYFSVGIVILRGTLL